MTFGQGLALGVLLQVLMVPVAVMTMFIAAAMSGGFALISGIIIPPLYWGAFQLIYIVPAILIAWIRGRLEQAAGLCAAAILVCLIHMAAIIWMLPTRG